MSEYVTVRNFLDTEVRTEEYPKGKLYEKGEKFPAEGLKVSEERLRQLSTYDNSAGDIFIKKVDENNHAHVLFVVDYAHYRYCNKDGVAIPRNLQYRLNDLIIKDGGGN